MSFLQNFPKYILTYIIHEGQRLIQTFYYIFALLSSCLDAIELEKTIKFICYDSVMFKMIHRFECSMWVIVLILA